MTRADRAPDAGANPANPSTAAHLAAADPAAPILWIDASAGAAGDMLLGALIDAGADVDLINDSIASLGLTEHVTIATESVMRAGLRASHAIVEVPESSTRRDWAAISELLTASALDPWVRDESLAVFELLAHAEARVHGIPVAQVHFHEVGGLDCIADIVGVVTAIQDLAPSRIDCSAVTVGFGRVGAEHGSLPVPGPAVTELFAAWEHHRAAPAAADGHRPVIQAGSIEHEACTPTAAALLTHLVERWGAIPAMEIDRAGIGAGTRDTAGLPNVMRVFLGPATPVTGAAARVEIACNIDDLDPRVWPYVIERLLTIGADDAWIVPIEMKKNRAGVTLRVLCAEGLVPAAGDVILAETSTIGMRVCPVAKVALDREMITVEVAGRPVGIKVARHGGEIVNVSAEYEDAAAAARASGTPLVDVLAEAVATAQAQLTATPATTDDT